MSGQSRAPRIEGQEPLPGAKAEEIRSLLRSAFADEWLAAYYYMLTGERMQGPATAAIANEFRKEAAEEITKHPPL